VSFDYAAAEDAVRAWVKTGTGFDDAHVIFDAQDGNRPSGSYATVKLNGIKTVGLDGTETTYDDQADAGEEISITHQGDREFDVIVTIFSRASSEGASSTTGAASARAIAGATQTALNLSSVRSGFKTAGISCFDYGEITSVPEIFNADFQGRSVLTAHFYAVDTLVEKTGYIAQVNGTSNLAGVSKDYTIKIG